MAPDCAGARQLRLGDTLRPVYPSQWPLERCNCLPDRPRAVLIKWEATGSLAIAAWSIICLVLGVRGTMQAQHVSPREQFVQLVEPSDAKRLIVSFRLIGAIKGSFHT